MHRLKIVFVLTLLAGLMEVLGSLFIARSLALFGDGLHMFIDVGGIGTAWFFAHLISRSDKAHHARLDALSGCINGTILSLFGLGVVGLSIYRFFHPSEVAAKNMIIFALIGLGANLVGLLLLFSLRKKSFNVKGAYLHVLWDVLASFGVVAGGSIIVFTDKSWIDPAIALLIGGLLAYNAFMLLHDSLNHLLNGNSVPG